MNTFPSSWARPACIERLEGEAALRVAGSLRAEALSLPADSSLRAEWLGYADDLILLARLRGESIDPPEVQ